MASIQDENSNYALVKDELGDLLLQILLHSKIAEEHNHFAIVDVIDSLKSKLIERHPHVFGDVKLDSAEEVEKQWETIKQKDNSQSIFDDINSKLPSITRAFKTQRKAKKLNLSYADYEEALSDLLSEVKELEEAKKLEDRKSEIGDVLFSIINVLNQILPITHSEIDDSLSQLKNISKKINTTNLSNTNTSLQLAYWIKQIPLIYYPAGLHSSAIRFKNSLQENSKSHVIIENVIETCHNGIVSWEKQSNVQPILLQGMDDNLSLIHI